MGQLRLQLITDPTVNVLTRETQDKAGIIDACGSLFMEVPEAPRARRFMRKPLPVFVSTAAPQFSIRCAVMQNYLTVSILKGFEQSISVLVNLEGGSCHKNDRSILEPLNLVKFQDLRP